MSVRKVSVIGAGFVGASTVQRISEKELANVVLVDIAEGIPQGKALDMKHSSPLTGASHIKGTNNFKHIKDSQVIVVTAGIPRKPGMSREDLAKANYKTISAICENIIKYAPNAITIVVTNPLDVMAYAAYKKLGMHSSRVFGMGGVLDTARYKSLLAEELQISVSDISAIVLGEHGDKMMPLINYTTVAGIPIKKLLERDVIDRIVEETKKSGGKIVGYLKTGSAYYAPSAAVTEMVDSILNDKKRLFTVSTLLQGEYGIKDAFVGVPVVLGVNGVERVIELELHGKQLSELKSSTDKLKKQVKLLDI